ncbi:MAG: hypothetical protein IPN01_22625 [Deltaproteobacteria bacterium]|nr:hypothetical protein [Deltaproteobacteria bacterium]
MGFLDRPDGVIDGVIGLGVRLALLCNGAMALRTYTALVRGEERPILDPHPADVPALVRYLVRRVAWEGLIWPLGVAALCWPLWSAGPEIYLTAVGLAAGGWGAGLLMGFPVHLGAVWAAESPGLAGLFNLIRGQNPQLQAALLYAPGAALALGAVGVGAAATGARLGLSGQSAGWLLLLTPWVLGAVAFGLTRPALSDRTTGPRSCSLRWMAPWPPVKTLKRPAACTWSGRSASSRRPCAPTYAKTCATAGGRTGAG